MKYNKIIKYQICLVFLLLIYPSSNVFAQDTFSDTFSVIAYNQNNGSQNWSTNWIETGDDGSANNPGNFNARRIYINNGQVGFNQNQLLFIDLDGATIERGLDLSAYGAASLTLDFDSRFRGSETLVIEFFNNTTGLFETATTINTSTISSLEYTLTPDQISAASRIRIRGGDNNWPNNQGIFIDNVQITAYIGSILVDDVTVNESAGTATFTATYTGPFFLGVRTVDYTTVDDSAFADSDYTTTSGTLSFTTLDRTETITVPIIDNNFVEATETYFIRLSNPNTGSLLLSDGTGTIIDDVGDTPVPVNTPLILFDEFSGYFDYALTGGTLRDSDTNTCSITANSNNTLTTAIPAGAIIEKAYLFWAHSGGNADDVVTFEGQTVVADIVNQATFFTQPYHGMVSDVTALIQGIPNPSTNIYDFGGLSVDNTDDDFFYCGGNTTLGGWSLMIFYTESSLPSVRINLYNGFDGEQNSSTSYTLNNFFAIATAGAKTSVLSWEGDPGTDNNEILSLTTTSGTNTLVGDGDNDGATVNNPFNSTIFDNTVVPVVNNLNGRGIDLDTYDISSFINAGETTATTNVTAGGDFIMLNAVVLKVPGNLITGTVFEDINYPGGPGRNLAISSGVPIEGVTVELYDNTNTLIQTVTTDINGDYVFGGMTNGSYSVRVVNSTIQSTRGGGAACATCLPIQTFKRNFAGSTLTDDSSEIGGANPSGQDAGIGTLTGAQTISSVSLANEGVVDLDFGFNFNTIVNTNESGQGSLEQFIINSNNLDETGLDILAHPNDATLNPAAGEDTSIFMIPPAGDPFGRTADAGYIAADGYFDIPLTVDLTAITSANTKIDGRTQTAYSTDTNTGNITPSVTTVGTSVNALPTYAFPEIQVHRTAGTGYVFDIRADNVTVRNLAAYGNNNDSDGIRVTSGSNIVVTSNFLGVNALGAAAGNTRHGIRVNQGGSTLSNNYIAQNRVNGIRINNSVSVTISSNYVIGNGANCNHNISIRGGSGATIQNNLIENAGAFGINDEVGNSSITENTITTSGQDLTSCTNNSGIRLNASNTVTSNNIINSSGGSGIRLTGGNASGNLISQNSIFANGVTADALGIDINNNGVTINDSGDGDAGPNTSLNFPIFESASVSGTTLTVVGWSRPGATIEFFVSDISVGTAAVGDNQVPNTLNQDYGEGQTFIGSEVEGGVNDTDPTTNSLYNDVDGNTDTTNKFQFSITLSTPVPVGSTITATATISNSTSEFGGIYTVGSATVITNRKITYRVRRN